VLYVVLLTRCRCSGHLPILDTVHRMRARQDESVLLLSLLLQVAHA
jgi:hypothetical protein